MLLLALSSTALADSHHLTITSPAFADPGNIPPVYTCDGRSISPELNWTGVPAGTQSLALIVEDPDAPHGIWIHWVLYNLPPGSNGLNSNVKTAALPEGTQQAMNSWQRTGYGGPCPPRGTHHYFFRLYALDTQLPNLHKPTAADLRKAMAGHILEKTHIVGTYTRQQ